MHKLSRTSLAALLTAIFVVAFVATPEVTHAGIISGLASAALGGMSIGNMVLAIPAYIVSWFVLPLMSLFVYMTGMVLNFSVDYSVVNMAKHVADAHIDDTWRVIRDLANMSFIFVLIYTAIQTMLNRGDLQKTIKNMVIAALLINFSLFFTKAIIDASNVMSMFFYQAIVGNAGTTTTTGLAASFMSILNIHNLYQMPTGLDGTRIVIIGVAAIVIYLITSFSFLAVAIMFIFRFAMLLLVLALSPLMFVGQIIPGVGDKAKMWLDVLIGQAMFGPLYFMLTWVTLKVAQGLFGGGNQDIAAAILGKQSPTSGAYQADPSTMTVIINFMIVIFFIVVSALTAKNAAGKSSSFLTNKAFSFAGKQTFGRAGSIARGTVGRASANLAENETLKRYAAKGGIAGRAARLSLAAGEKGASYTFDARNAFGLGKMLGAGKVESKGFAKDTEQKVKDEKKFADSLKASDMTVYRAERARDAAKEGNLGKVQTYMLDRQARKDTKRLEKYIESQEASKKGASEAEVKEIDKRIALARKDLEAARAGASGDLKTYTASRVEQIKGIEEKDAKKAAAQELNIDVGQLNKDLKSNDETVKKRAEEALEKASRPNIGNMRKIEYARNVQEQRTFGARFDIFGRIAGVGAVKRENIMAATDIRKSIKDKPKEAKLADIVKEISEENKDEGAAGGTASGTPGGAAGPSTGGAPSEGGREAGEGGGSSRAPME